MNEKNEICTQVDYFYIAYKKKEKKNTNNQTTAKADPFSYSVDVGSMGGASCSNAFPSASIPKNHSTTPAKIISAAAMR